MRKSNLTAAGIQCKRPFHIYVKSRMRKSLAIWGTHLRLTHGTRLNLKSVMAIFFLFFTSGPNRINFLQIKFVSLIFFIAQKYGRDYVLLPSETPLRQNATPNSKKSHKQARQERSSLEGLSPREPPLEQQRFPASKGLWQDSGTSHLRKNKISKQKKEN